jgi:hypothetical protein
MPAEVFSDLSRALSSNADALAGAKWYFYISGTTTPQAVFTSANLSISHTNPVVADSGGQFPSIYFNSALSYRGILKDSLGSTIKEVDPINSGFLTQFSTEVGASLIGYSLATVYPANTIGNKLNSLPVSITDFGAVEGVDATTAIQAAINYVVTNNGGEVVFPSGRWIVNGPLVVSNISSTSFDGPRVSFRGEGARGSIIDCGSGDFTVLTVTGSNSPGAADANIAIENLTFNKPDNLGTCLSINRYSHMTIKRVRCNGSNLAIALTDVQESILEDVECTFANGGLKAQPGDFTSPNNITLLHCKMGNCHKFGADFVNSVQVNILGGSYEGNTNSLVGGSDPVWSIRSIWNDGTRIEGTVGLVIIGAYIENNGMATTSPTPTGDIWIVNTVAPMSTLIQGCTFQRHNEFFCTNNIRMETSGGFKHTLSLIANGHQGFYGYVPSLDRKYVHLSSPIEVYVTEAGCRFVDMVERPDFTLYNNDTRDFAMQAMVRFDGTEDIGIIIAEQAFNVTYVQKTAVGIYDIVYGRSLAGPYNAYNIQTIGGTGQTMISAESEEGFTIKTYESTGTTLADFQISIIVHGRSKI